MPDIFAMIWDHDFPSPTLKHMAHTIARYSRTDGHCYALRATLAARSGFHEKTVQASIKALREAGYIKVWNQYTRGGNQVANFIEFDLQNPVWTASKHVDELVDDHQYVEAEDGSGYQRLRRVANDSSGGADDSGLKNAQTKEPTNPPTTHDDSPSLDNSAPRQGVHDSPYINIEESKRDSDPAPSSRPSVTETDIDEALNYWNDMAEKNGLAKTRVMSGMRLKRTRARLEQHGLKVFQEAVDQIPRSDFLLGKSGDGKWRADFDFLVQDSSFAKVLEGSYANEDQRSRPQKEKPLSDQFKELVDDPLAMEGVFSDWRMHGKWPKALGPEPDNIGCKVPYPILHKYEPEAPALTMTNAGQAWMQEHGHLQKEATPPQGLTPSPQASARVQEELDLS